MATKASDWKKKGQVGNIELELPSENQCLVRRLLPEAFLTSGVIPDTLTDQIQKAIRTKKGLPPDFAEKMAADPSKLREGLKMIDQVVCYVVMEPHVEMPPTCGVEVDGVVCNQYWDIPNHTDSNAAGYHTYLEGARNPDVLYADEVDMDDKMFIFQFAIGGTADVERFRGEYGERLAGVPDGQAVQHKTKRASRSR